MTRGQFARFVAATGYRTEAERGTSGGFGWNGAALAQARQYTWKNPGFTQADNHPVTIVTYADAQAFCGWLSRQCGRECQLPTEAEWEYACRAGTTTAWHNGDEEGKAGEIAWYKPIAANTTHPVASLKPNPWGFYLGGNVYEWCRDWYAPYPPGPVTNPFQNNPNLTDKPRRVLRGGSWLSEIQHTRSAARYRNTPASRNADNGFRVMTYDLAARAVPPVRQPQSVPNATASGQNAANPPLEAARPPASSPAPPPQVVYSSGANHGVHSSFSFGALLCPLAVIVIVFIIVVSAVIRSRAPAGVNSVTGTSRTRLANIRTDLATDGFWLHGDDLARGTLISYVCLVDGTAQAGDVVYEPGPDGRQFVYTGGVPAHITIARAEDAGGAPPVIPPPPRRQDDDLSSSRWTSSHRHPSAY